MPDQPRLWSDRRCAIVLCIVLPLFLLGCGLAGSYIQVHPVVEATVDAAADDGLSYQKSPDFAGPIQAYRLKEASPLQWQDLSPNAPFMAADHGLKQGTVIILRYPAISLWQMLRMILTA